MRRPANSSSAPVRLSASSANAMVSVALPTPNARGRVPSRCSNCPSSADCHQAPRTLTAQRATPSSPRAAQLGAAVALQSDWAQGIRAIKPVGLGPSAAGAPVAVALNGASGRGACCGACEKKCGGCSGAGAACCKKCAAGCGGSGSGAGAVHGAPKTLPMAETPIAEPEDDDDDTDGGGGASGGSTWTDEAESDGSDSDETEDSEASDKFTTVIKDTRSKHGTAAGDAATSPMGGSGGAGTGGSGTGQLVKPSRKPQRNEPSEDPECFARKIKHERLDQHRLAGALNQPRNGDGIWYRTKTFQTAYKVDKRRCPTGWSLPPVTFIQTMYTGRVRDTYMQVCPDGTSVFTIEFVVDQELVDEQVYEQPSAAELTEYCGGFDIKGRFEFA